MLKTYIETGGGSSLPLVNTYSVLAMPDTDNTGGIAWVGTVCNAERGYRTNINEYFGDLYTAQVKYKTDKVKHIITKTSQVLTDFGS